MPGAATPQILSLHFLPGDVGSCNEALSSAPRGLRTEGCSGSEGETAGFWALLQGQESTPSLRGVWVGLTAVHAQDTRSELSACGTEVLQRQIP